jgi:hypothetical protein
LLFVGPLERKRQRALFFDTRPPSRPTAPQRTRKHYDRRERAVETFGLLGGIACLVAATF